MKNYYDYLSLLLDKDTIPDPQEITRIYICHRDREFLRSILGLLLHKRYYRNYYVKIRLQDQGLIVKKIRYDSIAFWNKWIAEINAEIYYSKIKKMQDADQVPISSL